MDPHWLKYKVDLEDSGRIHKLLGALDTIVSGGRRSVDELEAYVSNFPADDPDMLAAKAAVTWCKTPDDRPLMLWDLSEIVGLSDSPYRRMALEEVLVHTGKAHLIIDRLCKTKNSLGELMVHDAWLLADKLWQNNHQLWRPHLVVLNHAMSVDVYLADADRALHAIRDATEKALARIEYFAICSDQSALTEARAHIANLEVAPTTDARQELASML